MKTIKAPNGFYWKKLGVCGVDAGCLLIGDPCYFIGNDCTASERFTSGWDQFIEDILLPQKTQINTPSGRAGLGVVSNTAYGDGCYTVAGLYQEGDTSRCHGMLVLTGDVDLHDCEE